MKHLALVLTGDASLGAYTGGAVAEILRALEGASASRDDGSRTVVSVLTGVGTGALAAGLAARSLVVNPGLLPWTRRFWTDALDADTLLNPDREDRRGLLDPAPLEELTRHLVAGAPASDDRPSSSLGPLLLVGLPLLRVASGGPRSEQPARGPGAAGSYGGADPHAAPRGAGEGGLDLAVFRLAAERAAADPVWKELREAVLAATSEPPLLGARRLRGGPDGELASPGAAAGTPLELASRLAAHHPSAEGGEWTFVVIDPRGGTAPGSGSRRPDRGFVTEACRWMRAALGGVGAREILGAVERGERDGLLARLVPELPHIHGRLEDPDAVGLGRLVGRLAEEVAEREVRAAGGAGRSYGSADPVLACLDANLARIQASDRYRPAFRPLASRAGRTRLAKLVYVLEAVSGGTEHRAGPVHRVSPPEGAVLAGGRLGGLGGYLVPEWRRYDFGQGALDARALLQGELADHLPEGSGESVEGTGTDRDELPPPPPGLPPRHRGRLLSFLEAEAGYALDGLGPGGLAGLWFGLARGGLERRLARRALEALEALEAD